MTHPFYLEQSTGNSEVKYAVYVQGKGTMWTDSEVLADVTAYMNRQFGFWRLKERKTENPCHIELKRHYLAFGRMIHA